MHTARMYSVIGMVCVGNWTFRPFVSSPLDLSPPARIQCFMLTQLKVKTYAAKGETFCVRNC